MVSVSVSVSVHVDIRHGIRMRVHLLLLVWIRVHAFVSVDFAPRIASRLFMRLALSSKFRDGGKGEVKLFDGTFQDTVGRWV